MDIKHHYYEKGDGENLILLHGNGEDGSNFVAQVDDFSRYFHVWVLDTRGHGKTPRGSKPFTIRQFANDLYDFMNEHNIDKSHILGFSDGANIAMLFAINYPDRVNKLILDGGNLDTSGIDDECNRWIENEYQNALRTGDKKTEELMTLMLFDPNINPNHLKKITSPTLVMAGTHDLILKEHTELIASMIADARLEFVEGDHFIAYKNPSEFDRVVLDFLL